MKKARIEPMLLLVAALCLTASNCSKEQVKPSSTNGAKVELLEKPESLLNPHFTPGAARLHGVALGDLKEEVPCNLKKVNDADWYHCDSEGQAGFGIRDGRVTMFILQGKVLESFSIHSLEDIEKRFGPADQVEVKRVRFSDLVYRTTFIYHDRGLRCTWLASGYFLITVSD